MSSSQVLLVGYSGHSIAALIEGPESGLPVLLAHGGGQTKRAWKRVSAMLAEHGFLSFALDLRGHGDSDWAIDGAYDIVDFAGDLVAIAGGFERRPVLIGASLGGLAGLMAEGEVAPGTFASLTLVDIAPQMEAGGVTRVVGFMEAHAREGFASPEEAAKVISEYLPHRPSRKASSGLAYYLRQKPDGRYYWHWDPAFIDGVMRRHAERSDISDFGRTELDEAASRLALPVHLIRGGSSDLVSPEAVAHFLELVPHAEYSDIADATHMVVGDQNDAFGDAIVEFLMRTHGKGDAA
ncbi:MAG: alpha/beta fold hydrolase [Blastomonas fulva]|jgi:pimeloyl-ACP methyl ester carboxylesterase|uniref:alpha/beta fold hydrolase n=1 Tax=Alphaproteobacteria TaxID=28211 RepID=UPI0006B88209|nr:MULTISPECIES: alpha/beta hydrolase [unclassified Blastomonas]KPF73341.1 peroxidase [Blastomonas sp. AAP25]MCO5795241.1 alpha/beta hydrolase [Blastomonas sp.]